MATNARQIHHAPHPCPLVDQSIFEAYCDDLLPDRDIEATVGHDILEVKVILLPVVSKMKKVKVV